MAASLAMTAAGCGGSKKTPSGAVTFEKTTAAEAMASVFSHPSSGSVPADVVASVTQLTSAPVGRLLVHQGRLLLSNLGPKHRSIYVFPTAKGRVCFDITHLGEGCKQAFIVGAPASVDGGSLYFPPSSGPRAELAGLTKDGVIGVQVVLNGKSHRATFGHDAWYYRFPTKQTPGTGRLIVRLADRSERTVPIRISGPRLP
jgi:hypothetical protein